MTRKTFETEELLREYIEKSSIDRSNCMYYDLDREDEPHGHGKIYSFRHARQFVLYNQPDAAFIPYDDFTKDKRENQGVRPLDFFEKVLRLESLTLNRKRGSGTE